MFDLPRAIQVIIIRHYCTTTVFVRIKKKNDIERRKEEKNKTKTKGSCIEVQLSIRSAQWRNTITGMQ